jgi:hypothetical protein
VVLNDSFSDGQAFDTSFAPFFKVTEHNITTGGNFAIGNYSVTNPGTNGTVNFNLSSQLLASGADTKLLGGKIGNSGGYTGNFGQTTGIIKFRTVIKENFATQFPSGDSSVDNGDYLSNNVSITGNVLKVNTLTPTGFNESDSSGVGLLLPRGQYSNYGVSVYAINGNLTPGNVVVPGDQVTYRIKYTIPFGDIEKLNFVSELPFPVFDLSSFYTTSIFNTALPAVDTVSYGPSDTVNTFTTLNPGGFVTPTLSVDVQNNKLQIDYGTFDDPTTNLTPVTVDLLYTLQVGNQPTQNNLLTNIVYELESSTNAGDRLFYNFASLQLGQPQLSIQKGVVATTESAITQAVYSQFFPVVGNNPPTVNFQNPGATGTQAFNGTINSSLLATNNYFDSDVTAYLY